MDKGKLLNSIPKVDDILNSIEINDIQRTIPRTIVVESVRAALSEVREKILTSNEDQLRSYEIIVEEIIEIAAGKAIKSNENHLKRLINATGVIIHTNLGRSPLCKKAVEAVNEISKNYSNLEYNLESGERGSRYSHVEYIITRITGAEAAMVVNNNAAAVLLVLSTLCRGKEAIVSRGELVEIGGSFRIPEVMEQSGAKLVEVGATNRTHLYDYENAINQSTGVLLKVHTSNYRILGFTEAVSRKELVSLGNKNNIPVLEDIGSGNFIDLTKYGIEYEPTVQEAVNSGIDVVTFSGDKMLGGPQAGIIVGNKKYIDLMKKNPLTRALRIDKMTLAALEATMKEYIEEENAIKNIPSLRMIVVSKEELKSKAKRMMRLFNSEIKEKATINIIEEFSQIGGGAMPLEYLPTYAITVKPTYISVNTLGKRLRDFKVPIIARIYKDSLLFDARTIEPDDFQLIRDALKNSL